MTASEDPTTALVRARIVVSGMVQGVGFRPFVHRLATQLGLTGWVLNSTEGVIVEVEGKAGLIDRFAKALQEDPPPRSRVDRVGCTFLPPIGHSSFAIETSQEAEGSFILIPPDICICDDCLQEMRNPADRRFRYPFINCSNCGPRFTVVKDIPYDRPKTTMECFPLCPECRREYDDPANRRFHAQPTACPDCGPTLWLTSRGADGYTVAGPAAIQESCRLLAEGAILSIKGLGGFHLACDAANSDTVAELRRRKRRSDKPFALMAPDAATAATFCHLSDEERRLLESPQRPIVLLRRRAGAPISPLVAPGNRFLGVMLPYTPLHYLLFDQSTSSAPRSLTALVMTSGNLSEEPIATGNREALKRLDGLADAFLLHNRDIQVRCDDSVTRVFRARESVIRRARGYAPFPIRLGFEMQDLLACGAELKSTFTFTRGSYAFLSQHIGNLENAETMESFTLAVEHFQRLFRLKVTGIAHDLHPEYLSTRFAWGLAEKEHGLPLIPVQHHHAHIAACMAENAADQPVIGVAFDGTGYGDDGRLWGGEFLVCDLAGYRRAAHLKYLPLPGGEAAIRQPYRMAASYLVDCFGAGILDDDLPPLRTMNPVERAVLGKQIEGGINAPPTSSVGRLFDAVSSLIGLRQVINYEGQAAIELEMAALEGVGDGYRWALLPGETRILDLSPTIRQIVEDFRRGTPTGVIAARFHNTVANLIGRICDLLRQETGIALVALSGGVFQNLYLLDRTCRLLESLGFRTLVHHQVPPNDGGVSLGQAVIANRVLSGGLVAHSRRL